MSQLVLLCEAEGEAGNMGGCVALSGGLPLTHPVTVAIAGFVIIMTYKKRSIYFPPAEKAVDLRQV